MRVTLENVRVMEKEVKMDKEGNPNYILHCYQPGEKSLIPVKGLDFDTFSAIEEEDKVSLSVKLIAWAQGNNYGISVRYLENK